MPHSFGVRARTRDLFSKAFRTHGQIGAAKYLVTYKIGDIVDIKVDGAVQKGMPFKCYHGRTGRVWNVTKRAIGVEVNKKIRGRIVKKRLHVRVEHIKKSRCREEFLKRAQENDARKREAKKQGVKVDTRRVVRQPREGYTVRAAGKIATDMRPLDFEFVA